MNKALSATLWTLWFLTCGLCCQTLHAKTRLTLVYSQENYDFNSVFNRFTEQTGIEIASSRLLSGDMKTELLTRSDTNTLPDAAIVPADFIGLKQVNFSTIDDSLINPQLASRYLTLVRQQNQQYGIPLIAGNHLMLYFNRALIEQPATDWVSLQRQATVLPPDTKLIGWAYSEMYWLIPFLGAFDAMPTDGDRILLNQQGTREAIRYYHGLSETGIVDDSCSYQCATSLFRQGKQAYMINGSWAFSDYALSLQDNLGVALLPDINGNPMKPYYSAHVLVFPNQSLNGPNGDALRKLATFMQLPETQLTLWQRSNALPTHSAALQQIQTDDVNVNAMLEQLSQAVPIPTTANMAIVWEALLQGFNRYHGGAMTADEATRYMQYIAIKSLPETP
ncbi:extracellular solute-binding protein [Aestuariibacter halophilus]|uniref:Extracellular solute-binding protein n=1 Tax=Fluctibacter halophilus TaxID=226011 RepID=A0ABS8G2F1_9ALTE|nr:extracellular solute-binding protein [Aestuariibacter halophilus]MCC2614710.1 extracellular solute-binding protein [Aestuariibacter halophilus]